MGLLSAYAATKGAVVYCFEPCSYTFSLLKETQKLYPNQIYIYNYGLGKVNGKSLLALTDNIGANHLYEYKVNLENFIIDKEEIKIITLDSFCKDNNLKPNFIKIDTEGAELDIISGSKDIIFNYNPKIVSAIYHNFNDKFKIIHFFENNFNNYISFDNNTELFLIIKEQI